MGCISTRSRSCVKEIGDVDRETTCPHIVHACTFPSLSSHCGTDTTRSRSRFSPVTGDGDVERDVEDDEMVEAGMVLNEAYDPDVSVAVVSVELDVPGRDPGRGLGPKRPGLELERKWTRSSSPDVSAPLAPTHANGL